MSEPIRASTLILLRDVPGQPPETLMIRRGAHLSFAADRIVFPGGRIDRDDLEIAARSEWLAEGPELDEECLAARIGAIRETIEEVGLAPGIEGISENAMLREIRSRLRSDELFSKLIAEYGLRLDPHALHPFSRWLPQLNDVAKRFDTRFYIARAPELGEATADGSESSDCRWASAATHLAGGKMIFPTLRNLERVGLFSSFEDGVAYCSRYPIDIVSPTIVERDDGERWLCFQENLGYPVTAQRLSEVERDNGFKIPEMTREPG